MPITESFPLSATNPYGRTKLFIEEARPAECLPLLLVTLTPQPRQILRDLHASDAAWSICLLRYFNPVGKFLSCSLVSYLTHTRCRIPPLRAHR